MTLACAQPAARDVGLDVLDVLGGLTALTRRSPTLDGSVPIRVAQGCVPLLEGNAWGLQITLARRIELRRRRGAWSVTAFEHGDELARMTRANVPMLLGDGTLRPGAWAKRLERGVVDAGRGRISLFTGLFVRPRAGLRLRLSTLANRRSWLYTIDEAILDDTTAFCPLVLDIVPGRDVDAFALDGEIATLGVLPAHARFESCTLDEASEVARAHVGFYDAEYFATKQRGTVARKYRDEVARSTRTSAPPSEPELVARVVEGGPSLVEPAAPRRLHRATGATAAPPGTPPDRLVVRNAVAFTTTFDGYKVTIDPDRDALDRYARDVRARWQAWFDTTGTPCHQGALLYLTKYFTPHPPGEPHFFVKPCSLIATPPGSSLLIDGCPGHGYDVLRGVVRSDAFHAAPAVFQLWRPGETIAIARGAVLAELFVFPRALDDTTFEASAAGANGAWA